MSDKLYLQWGTLKGWDISTEPFRAALQKYVDTGDHAAGSMMQRDTAEQKQALCEVIDAVDGEIISEWTGERLSKEDAKKYVLEYPEI